MSNASPSQQPEVFEAKNAKPIECAHSKSIWARIFNVFLVIGSSVCVVTATAMLAIAALVPPLKKVYCTIGFYDYIFPVTSTILIIAAIALLLVTVPLIVKLAKNDKET